MRITLTSNIDEVRKQFSEFSDRRFKSAVATALTRTARAVGDEWTQQLSAKLDRPTPATTRVVQMEPGPMPTLIPSTPALIRASAASAVAMLPAMISTPGKVALARMTASMTPWE